MRALPSLLFLVACQPDPLVPELEARPGEVDLYPALLGPDGPHQRVRLFNAGTATAQIDEWSIQGEGASRLRIRGPRLPLDVAPGQRVEITMDIGPLSGLTEESAAVEVRFRGYSGIGESASLVIPVRVVVPGRCDVDEDGFVAARCGGDDCVDQDDRISPGATETCNGVDDDCDGQIDPVDLEGSATFYFDADGDGFGDPDQAIVACQAGPNEVADGSDCDDTNPWVHPGAPERCDEADNDCDGAVDNDAFNGVLQFTDADGDGFGDPSTARSACALPAGSVLVDGDCDDENPDVRPGTNEVCNGIDDDCDGRVDVAATDAATWFPDADGDGWGALVGRVRACAAPPGHQPTAGDCDDADPSVAPGAIETCNGKDDNCDGVIDEAGDGTRVFWYRDLDRDGYGDRLAAQATCGTPAGYVADNTDCDDLDTRAFPGAPERCNGKDDDCDGAVDDGAVCVEICGNGVDDEGDGLADCDDPDCLADPTCVVDEVCGNEVDDDLNGLTDCEDPVCAGQSACALVEICSNGQDDDGDGAIDCDDDGCFADPACWSTPAAERCDNGVDDDGDGDTDCDDVLCGGDPACHGGEACFNGVDDDADGLADCADPQCTTLAYCTMPLGIWAFDGEQRRRLERSVDRLRCPVPFSSEWRTWTNEASFVSYQTEGLSGVAIGVDATGRRVVCPFQVDEEQAIDERRHVDSPEAPGVPEVRLRPPLRRGFRTTPGCPLTVNDLPVAYTGGYPDPLLATRPPSADYFPASERLTTVQWLGIAGELEALPTGVPDRDENTQERHQVDGVEVWCERTVIFVAYAGFTPFSTPSRAPWPWDPFPSP